MNLLSNLSYDPSTGLFTWSESVGRFGGNTAGWVARDGYVRIQINGRSYLAHRLAWLAVYGCFPGGILDHKNRIRSDNRIENLREASRPQNAQNSKLYANCPSGVKGVRQHTCGKWHARITINKKQHHLGLFNTKDEAAAARSVAAAQHFGEFGGS
jgi:hypothetical protein